jgi:type IV fimbrial biogenesis protein FimT
MQAQPGVAINSTSGRQELSFHPDGSSPGSNVTFTLCDVRGASHARAIVVSNSGRARKGVPDAAHAAAACAQVRGG